MKIKLSVVMFLVTFCASAMEINFDSGKESEILKNWETGYYGTKGKPIWSIEKLPSAPSKEYVLIQRGQAPYIWNIYKDQLIQNGYFEARVNIISGKEDPEAGVVWRHIDGKNYYYIRANALEKNIIFYRMNKGKKELVKVAETQVNFNQWHKIRVVFNKKQIEVFFDGKPLINIKDDVFLEKGSVGLFTTADTISAFDDLSFSAL